MKLTPLGKTLLFFIGLGLIVTALYRFVPREKQFWRQWMKKGPSTTATTPGASHTTRPSDGPSTAAGWVSIPGGRFLAGASGTESEVSAFRIQRSEVTNREYAAFLAGCAVGSDCGPRELPAYWDDTGYLDTHADYPVVFVSWGDASAFCRWQNARLPTAREWEKAARGDDGRAFPWGEALDAGQVNILGSERRGEKARAPKQIASWAVSDSRYARDASPYGVLGMGGNVSEWTASASEEEPDLMLVAGGSWDSWDLNDARTFHRIPKPPTDRSSSVGFRCAAAPR
jgi:iron(II)-dependent oxidoreductase